MLQRLIPSTFVLGLCMGLMNQNVQAQAPTYNPYIKVYGAKVGHWTDSLKWSNVVNVTTLGAIPNDNQDDYTAIAAGIDQLAQAGGGVLYFPAGMYNSSETLRMKSGVILRGDTIPAGQNNPKLSSFEPVSKIWFPQYVFDTLANGGTGTDRNTAFKLIEGEKECSNSGVIDLDINRAVIKYGPEWITVGAPHQNRQPAQRNRNILVMGCRSNNAALLDPRVPSANQKPWQVLIWRFTNNIDVSVWSNAIVARNRLNDGVPADNFMMEGYMIEFRGSGGWRPLKVAQRPLFDYNAHYGIAVNRKKTFIDPNTGRWAIDGYPTWASPEQEPTLFSPGIEILDNWIYKTNRVAIMAAGTGLVIKGNEMYDDPTKTTRTDFLGPTGQLTPQGATTFENRGIDFSGWDVTIENNTVQAFRHLAGGYLSTDGEGILLQECCGGTQVNDYKIRNNIMLGSNYIGIYKMRDINNLEISGNDMRSTNILATANTNGANFHISNTIVRNNINVTGISLNGSLGGTTNYIEDNAGSGGISTPCHTIVRNNSGFSGVTYNTGGGQPCASTPTVPQGMQLGQLDSAICNQGIATLVTLRFKVTNSSPGTATLDVLLDGQPLTTGVTFDPADSTASYDVLVPGINGSYAYTGIVRNNGLFAFTKVRTVRVNCAVTSSRAQLADNLNAKWLVYPNPTAGVAYVHSQELTKGMVQFNVYNMAGQLVHASSQMATEGGFTHQIETGQFAKGVYRVAVTANGQRSNQMLVVQ